MLEREVEKEICDYAASRGIKLCLKLNGEHNRGKPDRMFIHNGRVLVLEVKAPGKHPTPGQLNWLRKFAAEGCVADWADTPEKGFDHIDDFLEGDYV